jgi:signal transduction histidine kinase
VTLLENALKYSPGGGLITVTAHHESGVGSAADAVRVEVSDPGVGMDPKTVAHCFDKFWQADPSGTRRYGGTGIGLYVVRSLMEAMGGEISVRSEPEQGSTFVLRFIAVSAVDDDNHVEGSTNAPLRVQR